MRTSLNDEGLPEGRSTGSSKFSGSFLLYGQGVKHFSVEEKMFLEHLIEIERESNHSSLLAEDEGSPTFRSRTMHEFR